MSVDIIVEQGDVLSALQKADLRARCFYVIDEKVGEIHRDKLGFIYEGEDYLICRSGEVYKSLEGAAQIWDRLLDGGYQKRDVLVAIGGGVIGDMAGLAASCYKRGLRFVLVPTTLLSMVDSSIGSKTGLNYGSVKNSVGSYYEAEKRLICYDFLDSLPEDEILCGLAEIIKIAAVCDEKLFECIEELGHKAALDRGCIERAMDLKKAIVAEDPFERKRRKILNFGHTMGHALEAYLLDREEVDVKHGYAVAWGMLREAELGLGLGLTGREAADRLKRLIAKCSYNRDYKVDMKDLLPYLRNDKKRDGRGISFALMSEIGGAEMVEVSEKELTGE